ncbi:hypothetical protein [Aquamicrobium sp. LC103]|uniref:hypothetical protein n=1 Tax=Aquamicrobium sp. LC103 TaxID=1120658 RepID=UPI00063E6F18|nr:hypothetical protein [Aquamicrobium sp. LC103]TKT82504.1 hypothetical protein XW59_000635 [Aquamicrobium sp. LC103]
MQFVAPPSEAAPDFLVSVVLAGDVDGAHYREILQELARRLGRAFQFWEILLAVPEAGAEETSTLVASLKGIANLRILRVSAAGSFYRRRLAGATEAIGEVVLLSTFDEIDTIDVARLARDVYLSNGIFALTRQQGGTRVLAPFAAALGTLSGYRVDHRDALTIGFPRSALENILARPDAEILLRFEPLSGIFTFNRVPLVGGKEPPRRRWNDWRHRIGLVGDMMVSASPRILRIVAFVSLSVAGIAVFYAFYAALVWLLKADVAPGWLTTSLLQSLTVLFLGISISAISVGLVRMFDLLSNEGRYAIVDEVISVDLIGSIKTMNVDFVAGDPAPLPARREEVDPG